MIINIIVGIVSGFLGAIGIGGGSVLIIYLTLFLNMPQLKSQGINLLFFIPCSAVGILFHIKNKLIDFKSILPLIIFGILGVICGYFIGKSIDEYLLRKIFGVFLIVLAVLQLQNNRQHKLAVKNF